MIDEKYLYHISPLENEESIEEQGFLPNAYFIRGHVQNRTRSYISAWLTRRFQKLGRGNNYIIYKVDVEKLPEEIEFIPDPENKPMFVYTKQVVPYSSVIEKDYVNLR